MPVSADTLALLMESGVTGEALLAVVRSIDADAGSAKPPRTARQERNRRYYEKHKTSESVLKKTSDKTSEGSNDIDNSNLQKSSLRSVRDSADAAFEAEFWPVYPRRAGSNPKQPAKQKFVRIVEAGVDPGDIVAGLVRYAASVVGADPQFTCTALIFLNQRRWQDEHVPRKPVNGAHAPRAGPGRPEKRNEFIASYERDREREREQSGAERNGFDYPAPPQSQGRDGPPILDLTAEPAGVFGAAPRRHDA